MDDDVADARLPSATLIPPVPGAEAARLVNVATPFLAVATSVPCSAPVPLATEIVTTELSL